MPKQPNKSGGGARTNINGLYFEQTTSLDEALINAGYKILDYNVYNNKNKIEMSVPKKKIYKCLHN